MNMKSPMLMIFWIFHVFLWHSQYISLCPLVKSDQLRIRVKSTSWTRGRLGLHQKVGQSAVNQSHMLCSSGYGSIPTDTFLVGWTSIYQLFWGEQKVRLHVPRNPRVFCCQVNMTSLWNLDLRFCRLLWNSNLQAVSCCFFDWSSWIHC